MRDQTTVYHHMLRLQADMSYPLERPWYSGEAWHQSMRVFDFGAGNAMYTAKLHSDYPDKEYTCLEYDPKMAAVALSLHDNLPMTVIQGSLDEVPGDYQFDFLIARLVTLHLAERQPLYDWAIRHASANAAVLVIDAHDAEFYLDPPLPCFLSALSALRTRTHERGGNRDIREAVEREWPEAGFAHLWTKYQVINSALDNVKERMFLYMYLTAELGVGSPLPSEIVDELVGWVLSPSSYVQYGVFASLFQRPT